MIEDDYDGEFRYDVRSLPALHSMTHGPDVVAYIGTASKILSAGLRIAWLIPPAGLREPVHQALDAAYEVINTTAGYALAHFITRGHLTSHLARAARTYAARRRSFIAALRDAAPALQVTGIEAGLHLVAKLPPGLSETAAQRRLHNAGVAVDILGSYGTTALTQQALVCSYALLPESQARAATAVIASHIVEPAHRRLALGLGVGRPRRTPRLSRRYWHACAQASESW